MIATPDPRPGLDPAAETDAMQREETRRTPTRQPRPRLPKKPAEEPLPAPPAMLWGLPKVAVIAAAVTAVTTLALFALIMALVR